MKRRQFLQWSGAGLMVGALGSQILRAAPLPVPHPGMAGKTVDEAWFRASRRYAELPFGRIAYVERGAGPAAVFLHGAPLNGFQWPVAQAPDVRHR